MAIIFLHFPDHTVQKTTTKKTKTKEKKKRKQLENLPKLKTSPTQKKVCPF